MNYQSNRSIYRCNQNFVIWVDQSDFHNGALLCLCFSILCSGFHFIEFDCPHCSETSVIAWWWHWILTHSIRCSAILIVRNEWTGKCTNRRNDHLGIMSLIIFKELGRIYHLKVHRWESRSIRYLPNFRALHRLHHIYLQLKSTYLYHASYLCTDRYTTFGYYLTSSQNENNSNKIITV